MDIVELGDFNTWLSYGYDQGWISDVFCNTHDGPPMLPDEEYEWNEGGDPCSFHVRLWELS